MAYRCGDCNKFVSVELADPEFEPEVDGDQITGECQLVLVCADCGTELAEAQCDVVIDFDGEHDHTGDEGPEFDIIDYTVSPTDRFEGSGRFKKHLYGAEVQVTVGCNCGWSVSLNDIVEVQAASFDSLV